MGLGKRVINSNLKIICMKIKANLGLVSFCIISLIILNGCKNQESKNEKTVELSQDKIDSLKLKEESLTQSLTWEWAKGAKGTLASGDFSSVNSKSIVTDSEGNVYVVGNFQGAKIAFDNIISNSIGDNNSWNSNVFFTKYDSKGNVKWVKIIEDYSETNLAIDSDDNIYMTCDEHFISKYNTKGDVIWKKNTELSLISIAINSTKGFYIIGSKDYPNRNLVKYDINGNILWSKDLTGVNYEINNQNGQEIQEANISVDNYGDVYLSGGYSSAKLKFGNTQLNRIGLNCGSTGEACDMESTNGFIIKCNPNGNVIWSKNIGETNKYNYTFFKSSATNNKGDIFLVGQSNENSFGGTFLTKYNRAGVVQWTKNISNCNQINHRINSVAVNSFGNVYICGFSRCESLLFGKFNETAQNGNLSFIVKYNQNGDVLCTKSLENIASSDNKVTSNCNKVITDDLGNVFITGYYKDGGLRFGKSTLSEQQQMGESFFIAKLKI